MTMTLENKFRAYTVIHTSLLLCKIRKSYLQEVGSSYHPQLRDSLEAAGYEGQFLQKVMMMLVVTMQ